MVPLFYGLIRWWQKQRKTAACKRKVDPIFTTLVDIERHEPSAFHAGLELAKLFFLGVETGRRAILYSSMLMILILVEMGLFMYYSNVQNNLFKALQEKSATGFYGGLWKQGAIIVLGTPIGAMHGVLAGALKLEWRKTLTQRFAKGYLADHDGFYRLGLTGEVDNPDQRICQDVGAYIEVTFSLVNDSFGTVFNTLGFAGVLYRISPTVFFSTVGYAIFGTVVTAVGVGPRFMHYQNECLRLDADMRYCFIRVSENAESIAFFKGGEAEYRHFSNLFDKLQDAVYRSMLVGTGFGTFSRTFHWITFAVAPLTVGPAYLRGEADIGDIAQAGMAFSSILGGLTLIMSKLGDLSTFAVRVRRLNALDEALQRERARVKATRLSNGIGSSCIASVDLPAGGPVVLRLREMTLRTPPRQAGGKQQTLTQCLSMELRAGQSLLITGESGIGKSSLLRAVASLWSDGEGRVEICGGSSVFFLPQKPYMFVGTLREQLLYPEIDRAAVTDELLEQALAKVGLDYIVQQHSLCDAKEWSSLLSLGEQQRVNFARVLLKPTTCLALIDEGTSACDLANESRLYGLLRQSVRSFVSVGHRPALQQHHSHALWLQRPQAPSGKTSSAHGPALFSFLSMAEYQEALASQACGG